MNPTICDTNLIPPLDGDQTIDFCAEDITGLQEIDPLSTTRMTVRYPMNPDRDNLHVSTVDGKSYEIRFTRRNAETGMFEYVGEPMTLKAPAQVGIACLQLRLRPNFNLVLESRGDTMFTVVDDSANAIGRIHFEQLADSVGKTITAP